MSASYSPTRRKVRSSSVSSSTRATVAPNLIGPESLAVFCDLLGRHGAVSFAFDNAEHQELFSVLWKADRVKCRGPAVHNVIVLLQLAGVYDADMVMAHGQNEGERVRPGREESVDW